MADETPQVRERPRRRSGRVVPNHVTLGGRVIARVVWTLVRGVDATLRYRLDDPTNALATVRQGPAIFTIWHNRLALCLRVYERYIRRPQPTRRMAALVSASRDGARLARVLELAGVQPVRGSTSRRGAQGLLELVSWGERGLDLALTPDGPRGPRYVAQSGAIDVAAVTGFPIVPVGYDLSRCWTAPSWDGFLVPLPLTRCVVRFGEPLRVPRGVADAEREDARRELERRLLALTDQPQGPTRHG